MTPTKFEHLTILQYQRLYELSPVELENYDQRSQILSILHGESPEYFESLPRPEYLRMVRGSDFIFEGSLDPPLVFSFKAAGVRFVIDPLLGHLSNRDYDNLCKWTMDNLTTIQNLHRVLALFTKPRRGLFNWKKWSREEVELHLQQHMTILPALGLTEHLKKAVPELYTETQRFASRVLDKVNRQMSNHVTSLLDDIKTQDAHRKKEEDLKAQVRDLLNGRTKK